MWLRKITDIEWPCEATEWGSAEDQDYMKLLGLAPSEIGMRETVDYRRLSRGMAYTISQAAATKGGIGDITKLQALWLLHPNWWVLPPGNHVMPYPFSVVLQVLIRRHRL